VRGITLTLLAGLAVLALGCQESGFDERKETARPLKVQHAMGETKVPGQAKHPVTLTTDALDDTLALGVRPRSAALPGSRLPGYLRSRARGVEATPAATRFHLAAVKAANPDVILGSKEKQRALYRRLKRIAPTVMSEGGGGQWKLNLRLHGEALGRTNDAEQLLTDWDRRTARLRRSLGGRGAKTEVSVVRVLPGGLRTAALDSFAGKVLADAGLARPPSQDQPGESQPASLDRPGSLDGDVVLLSAAPGAQDGLRRLESDPRWQRLRAARSGRVVRVEDDVWWAPGGVLAARAALHDLERALG
jgi:iron complex transport system substrate-binding protein